MWRKVAEPEIRRKETPPGNPGIDTKIRGFGGLNTPLVGNVRVDLPKEVFWIWFEDIGWRSVSYRPLSVTDFDPFLHMTGGVPRLKIWVAEWANVAGYPFSTILDTGYVFI